MDSLPTTNAAKGDPTSTKETILHAGAGYTQNFAPPKSICAHLNAFHAYAHHPSRGPVEANHYCTHVNEDVRQCILYDSDKPNARLIGIEYMITPKIFEELPPEEKKYWHSHVFEVKSGMLIMPTPNGVPSKVWEVAETEEMKAVVELYGKVFHLWQTDLGHEVPLGEPQLMTSFTEKGQFDFEGVVGERDRRFGVDYKKKAEIREGIPEAEVLAGADAAWKR